MAELTRLSDNVLGFWLKNGLVRASSGGGGKGSHRRFDRMQISIAAILGEVHRLGANIAALRNLALLLQRGVEISTELPLHPHALEDIASLRVRIERFRQGEKTEVSFFKEDDLGTRSIERLVAQTELDIARDIMSDYLTPDQMLGHSIKLSPSDYMPANLIAHILWEMDYSDGSDFAWLLWQELDEWKFTYSTERHASFGDMPSVESALYVGVGAIIRRVWTISMAERQRFVEERRQAFLANYRQPNFQSLPVDDAKKGDD